MSWEWLQLIRCSGTDDDVEAMTRGYAGFGTVRSVEDMSQNAVE